MKTKKSYCRLLEISPDYLVEYVASLNYPGPISEDYIRPIAEKYIEEIAQDIYETADHEDWGPDDLRLAFGRVLCRHLRIKI